MPEAVRLLGATLPLELLELLIGMRRGAQPWADEPAEPAEPAEPVVVGWAGARVAAAVVGWALPPDRISVAPEETVVAKLSVRPPCTRVTAGVASCTSASAAAAWSPASTAAAAAAAKGRSS